LVETILHHTIEKAQVVDFTSPLQQQITISYLINLMTISHKRVVEGSIQTELHTNNTLAITTNVISRNDPSANTPQLLR